MDRVGQLEHAVSAALRFCTQHASGGLAGLARRHCPCPCPAREEACVVTGNKLRRVPGEYSAPPWPLARWQREQDEISWSLTDGDARRLLCTTRILQQQSWDRTRRPLSVHGANAPLMARSGKDQGPGPWPLALALSLPARARRQTGRYIPVPAGGSKELARSPFRRGGCTDAIMRPRTTTLRKRRPAASRREIEKR